MDFDNYDVHVKLGHAPIFVNNDVTSYQLLNKDVTQSHQILMREHRIEGGDTAFGPGETEYEFKFYQISKVTQVSIVGKP